MRFFADIQQGKKKKYGKCENEGHRKIQRLLVCQ